MKSDPASKKSSTAMSNESEVWQGLCVEFSSGIRARAGFILKMSVVGYSSKTLCDGIPYSKLMMQSEKWFKLIYLLTSDLC